MNETETLGLVRYDAMCSAIVACHSVDEVKEIRARAYAFAVYARQAKNIEAERKCAEIRIRAERKAGELLKEMKEDGTRAQLGERKQMSNGTTSETKTLPELGITRDQSSKWQQLADIPEEQFEAAVSDLKIPTTDGLLNKHVRGTFGTGENEWYTPSEYIELARQVLGTIDLDPASSEQADEIVKATRFYSIADDGLTKEWNGSVWMNPPYSQPGIPRFAAKAIEEWDAGRMKAAIILTHNYTDTVWFQRLAYVATAICFTRGRIKFISPDGGKAMPTQGQAFFYFGPCLDRFRETFHEVGFIVQVQTEEPNRLACGRCAVYTDTESFQLFAG